jgi:predicted MFS family arabinose efflux permease
MSATVRSEAGVRYALFAGLCASFVGVGLARFAYTPLIPALIGAAWLTPAGAAYLGATNFAGYLAGALLSQWVARHVGLRRALRAALLLTAISFVACAWPLSELWLSLWRFLAGFTGALLMVLAAPGIVSRLPAARRGIASGVIFTGIGLGIAASGTLLPLLLQYGLRSVWLGFGALTLLLTVLAWQGFQDSHAAPSTPARPPRENRRLLRALYAEYGLNAFGLVPHIVFFVDFIARGLDKGITVGAFYWVILGIGASVGPMLAGLVADRIGFRNALRASYALQAIVVALPIFDVGPIGLGISALIAGASAPGVVALTIGRTQELVPSEDARRLAWRNCTLMFALAQAVAAYLMSYVFAQTHGYAILFALGAGALALSLVLDLVLVRDKTPVTS